MTRAAVARPVLGSVAAAVPRRASHIVIGGAASADGTRRVVRDAPVPVLTVPSKESES